MKMCLSRIRTPTRPSDICEICFGRLPSADECRCWASRGPRAQRRGRSARALTVRFALPERRARARARRALNMQFLDALEKEKLGVNIIPHLCTIARKIVPKTR